MQIEEQLVCWGRILTQLRVCGCYLHQRNTWLAARLTWLWNLYAAVFADGLDPRLHWCEIQRGLSLSLQIYATYHLQALVADEFDISSCKPCSIHQGTGFLVSSMERAPANLRAAWAHAVVEPRPISSSSAWNTTRHLDPLRPISIHCRKPRSTSM